jgi:UDP-N-acetylmuramate--alanine ligase
LPAHFADADTLTVLPIYAASEEPIPGVTAEALAAKIEGPRRSLLRTLARRLRRWCEAREGDLILTLGAGM